MLYLWIYGINPFISNQTVAAKILRKHLWGIFFMWFLFLPCFLLLCNFWEQNNTSVDMFQNSEQVSYQGSSCALQTQSCILVFRPRLTQWFYEPLLCISCHESALLLFIISVTVRKLDEVTSSDLLILSFSIGHDKQMKISSPESLQKSGGREMLCKVMYCMVALARGLFVCLPFGDILGRIFSWYSWKQVFMEWEQVKWSRK